MRKFITIALSLLLSFLVCHADEGMWIPMLLKKYNIEDMQQKGFKLSAEDIYHLNQASLKDAVIGLGREGQPFHHFCTGEFISAEGLVVTNHHCSFGMIQAHSSLEHNYLRDGFWASDKSEELVNPGITASVLVRMEDVTEKIQACLSAGLSEAEREKIISRVCKELEEEAVAGTNLKASIKPYFNGNQFFMSVFKIFKDVRLVGAPASAIGKFGGDTDNWMWPRHTGDFSVLRIYADENNEPAAYSTHNKPYRPDRFFKISLKGVKEGDFSMVFGYPGTTNEYLTSYAIDQLTEVENPHKIAIRTAKLNVINEAMNRDELLRIKYAAKAANVANAWKKWQGEMKGLKHFKTADRKRTQEASFQEWARTDTVRGTLLEKYRKLYEKREAYVLAFVYANEAGKRGAELPDFAYSLYTRMKKGTDAVKLVELIDAFYKDYDAVTDQRILKEMLKLYNSRLEERWIPKAVKAARSAGDYEAYVGRLYRQSLFTQPEQLKDLVMKPDKKTLARLEKDPVYQLAASVYAFHKQEIQPELTKIEKELSRLGRLWLAGLMEMEPEKIFYADANSTLRVAYGSIGGYSPADAVRYKHYTTLNGIIEKDNPDIYDYDVPQVLREVYHRKDFGEYTQEGEIPVCFIANNHTTGGNSGSPVLNAEGHLIGINFDRAWEGVMSDMQYDPLICRNIAVDIRYVLFVIDKVAGARHLLNELEIVRE